MAAGNITIDLLMRTGSFETDSKRAQKALRDLNRESVEFAKGAATALLGLAGTAAAAFLALERGASAIGKFKDLGDVIGDTGEAVASLQTAADVSGVSMDTIADTSVKLTKALSKVDEEGEGAAKALEALNIPLADFKKLSPVQQIDALSTALAGFKDDKGATETMEALVRGGSKLIPLLKELREQGGPRVIITQEQIDAADKFADSTAKLKSQVTQLGQSVLADLLPPFQAFVDEVGQADRALSIFSVGGAAVRIFFETITVLGANVIFVFKGIGTEIGGIAAQLVALASFDFAGFNAISKAIKEDAAKARAELDRFEQRILGATASEALTRQQRRVEDRGFDPRKSIDTSGLATGAGKDDPRKKLLENQLKALETIVKREQSLLADRNRFLDLFNGQGLVSIQNYYDAQVSIIESATTAQIAAYDKQLAALRAFQAQQTKATDRADTQGKIDEVIEKRSKLEQESSLRVIELSVRKTEEERKFAQQIEATRASVLELEGSLAKAAAIRFDQQNFELVRRLSTEIADAQKRIATAATPQESELAQRLLDTNQAALKLVGTLREAAIAQAKFAEGADLRNLNASLLELRGNLGAAAAIRFDEQNFALVERLKIANPEALKLVDALRAATIAQAEFNRAAQDAQRVTESLAIAEDRIAISRKIGAITELEALTRIAKVRQESIPQQRAAVEAAEAALAKSPENPQLILNVQRLRLELERLQAEADPIGDKFRSIFEEGFGDAFTDFLNGTKSASEAFKAFANSVLQDINRIVAQNLAQSLFGKEGPFGGIGTAIGGLFGGGGGTGAAAGTGAALGAVTAAATPTAASLTAVATSAQLAAAALAQVAGSSTTESFGEFFSIFGGAYAEGGAPPVGKVAIGGELGTELFAPQASQVLRAVMYGPAPRRGVQQVSGPTLIGADGPQFFRPTVPGVVIPADETEQILRNFGGAFAGGGWPAMGRNSYGGEEGAELFLPITQGLRPPSNEDSRERRMREVGDTYISVPVTGQVDRRTRHQIANDIAREQRAGSRLA